MSGTTLVLQQELLFFASPLCCCQLTQMLVSKRLGFQRSFLQGCFQLLNECRLARDDGGGIETSKLDCPRCNFGQEVRAASDPRSHWIQAGRLAVDEGAQLHSFEAQRFCEIRAPLSHTAIQTPGVGVQGVDVCDHKGNVVAELLAE